MLLVKSAYMHNCFSFVKLLMLLNCFDSWP